MEPQAYNGEAKPAVGEKLAQTQQLKVEEPSQLSERTLPRTTSYYWRSQAGCRSKVAQKPPAKTGEAKPTVGEKSASKPPAKSGGIQPAVGEKVVKILQL